MKQRTVFTLSCSAAGWLGVSGWPAVAAAADGGGLSQSQSRVLILLAVVGVAYLITHLALERIARRFGFVTGVEYIVLGVILGPVLHIVDADTVRALTPAIVLGTGSLGLYAGLQVNLKQLGQLRVRAAKSALVVSMATLLMVVGAVSAVLYYVWTPERVAAAMPGLLCVGTVALVADTSPLRSMSAFLGARGPAADFGLEVARFCSAIGIVAFGLIFCFYNTTDVPFDIGPAATWVIWFGIHLLLGGVLGLVFATFLRRDLSDEKIITVVMGMVIFTSGLAYYLQLSPIFVNFILGVVLINLGRHAGHVESRLRAINRPLYIVLFFFAGAGLVVGQRQWTLALALGFVGLVVSYLILRRTGRFAGSIAAIRVVSIETYGAGLGRSLLAPGALSVAMVLNFVQVFDHLHYVDIVYNGLLAAVIITEILSYPATRGWLIDVADVASPEQRKSPDDAPSEVD